MKGYIEEGGLVVCSFDTSGTPRKLERGSGRAITVFWKEMDKPLLTVIDKGVTEQFVCKSPAKFWSGLASLAAGIALGALLLASGPLGWLVMGALAAAAVFATVAYVRARHVCNSALEVSPNWTLPHSTTTIDKHKAILYNRSLLNCNQLGILMAIDNSSSANKASAKIAANNSTEINFHRGSQFIIGFIAAYTGGKNLALAVINSVLTAGAYSYGESLTGISTEKGAGISAVAAGGRAFTYDKYVTLISGSMKGKGIKMMYGEWVGGLKSAAAGIGVDYISNKIEESYSDKTDIVMANLNFLEGEGKINSKKY